MDGILHTHSGVFCVSNSGLHILPFTGDGGQTVAAGEGENKTPVTILLGLFEFIAATVLLNLNTVLKLKCILLSLLIVLKLKRKSRK